METNKTNQNKQQKNPHQPKNPSTFRNLEFLCRRNQTEGERTAIRQLVEKVKFYVIFIEVISSHPVVRGYYCMQLQDFC